MSQWLQSAKATVSAGASVISFTDNQDFSSVRAGDVVMVNGQIWQCVSGTRPDSVGKSTVTLAAPWPYTGASNVNAFVFRTTHDLLQLTSDARKLTNITKALLAAQEDILTGTTPTINVPIGLDPATGNEEAIPVTPWQYVINVVNASLGNISAIGAMSQAQFEAIREQNKERYAASAWVSFGNHEAGKQVNECKPGLYTSLTTPNTLLIGKSGGVGGSKTDNGILNFDGVLFHLPAGFAVKFNQAPDGKTTYNKSTVVATTHATVTAALNAQAADPANVELVTDPVDMWGFEAWLEEVNITNPHIYPYGLPQYQATTMDGIATSASTRPVTYYAVFNGDIGSKGKGLNFFALSDTQKKRVLANPKNNMYYLDDGRLVQWRLRQRTVRNNGNGDWVYIDASIITAYGLVGSGNTAVAEAQPQGALDVPYAVGVNYWTPPFGKTNWGFTSYTGNGAYKASRGFGGVSTNAAVNGECYFLVCGTINRLNQGGYHPSFNNGGAASWRSAQQGYWCCTWDNKDIRTKLSGEPTSKSACFTAYLGSSGNGGFGNIGTAAYDGYNRPDKRFYDAIYADGQGGVCRDMRYSANGVDLVDYAEADQQIKRGSYRGFDKLTFVSTNIPVTNVTDQGAYYQVTLGGNDKYLNGIKNAVNLKTIFNPSAETIVRRTGLKLHVYGDSFQSGNTLRINCAKTSNVVVGDTVFLPTMFEELTCSVGAAYLQTDVVGNPSNILSTAQLASGWEGRWIPEIPDGNKDYFTLIRKYIGSGTDVTRTYTSNNGVTWTSGNILVNSPVTNQSQFDNMPANYVVIYQYKAFSKQTESAVNGIVYGGIVGVGQVFASSYNAIDTGVLLCESLLNKFLTSATNQPLIDDVALTKLKLQSTQKLATSPSWGNIEHNPISLNSPLNGSIAFKALNYNVNINQQAFIQYAYTELKHNGDNWGDDGKVTIVDNQSTKTDLNGNTVLVGTAKLKEPIGWIKNKV